MKRVLCLFAASMLAFSTFSCSENKNKKSSAPVSETGEDISGEPVEREFMTYSAEDFATVDVNTTITDREFPYKRCEFSSKEQDFGSRISPCRDEKYRDRFMEYLDNGYREKRFIADRVAEWEMSFTDPDDLMITSALGCGTTAYIAVNFDTLCYGCHESSVFRYDTEKGELKEILHHSDPENSLEIRQICSVRGELFVDTDTMGICRFDGETGEMEQILESEDDGYGHMVSNDADRLIVTFSVPQREKVDKDYKPKEGEIVYSDDNENFFIEHGSDMTMKEYDFDTGEWHELYSVFSPAEESKWGTAEFPNIYGELFAWKEKPEGTRKYDVVTEEYRVSTGLNNCNIVYAGRDKLILSLSNGGDYGLSASKYVLHEFDFETMQHYIIDYTSYGGNCIAFGDGVITYMGGMRTGGAYYIMPSLGLVFPIESAPHDDGNLMNMSTGLFGNDRKNAMFMTYRPTKSKPVTVSTPDGDFTHTEYSDYEYIYFWFTAEGNDE